MNDVNQQTIQSYDDHVQDYIDNTPKELSDDFRAWLDGNLNVLPAAAKILELGSAFGRDADYMESKGFSVERSDASKGFVKLLHDQGHSARLLNAITDVWGEGYDMVFADAVLLHFNRDETGAVAHKAFQAVRPGGRFVFSLKRGDGDELSTQKLGAPRYFCYWQPEAIEHVLHDAGFSIVQFTHSDDYRPDKPQWLLVSAIRKAA